MKDLISRQAAIDAIRKDMYADKDYMSGLICDGIEDVLKAQPSAQLEIIRCKDCKYWKLWEKKETWTNQRTTLWLPCLEIITDKNWFCGNAERRTDDER